MFLFVIGVIVTRTQYWYIALVIVLGVIAVVDRGLFRKVDYVLLFTFLSFFIFSSSIAANEGISKFLSKAVAGNEYW